MGDDALTAATDSLSPVLVRLGVLALAVAAVLLVVFLWEEILDFVIWVGVILIAALLVARGGVGDRGSG